MALIKREYKDQETVITAENLNDIQDAVIALEDGLFSIDNDKSGEIITITDAAKRGFRRLNIYGKTTQAGTPTPDAPVNLVSVGDGGSLSVFVSGKNLLDLSNFADRSVSGVTITNNRNGSITLVADGTYERYYNGSVLLSVPSGRYKFIEPASNEVAFVRLFPKGETTYKQYNAGTVFEYDRSTQDMRFLVQYDPGTITNTTVWPMICIATETDDTYERYNGQHLSISTPNGLPGIPVASGGNYTDANGQQWICDEIDFARGAYVQRIGLKELTGGETYYDYISSAGIASTPLPHLANTHFLCSHSIAGKTAYWANADAIAFNVASTGRTTKDEFVSFVADQYTNGTPVTVVYILAAPIETPLSNEELAAYAALHTYKEHTTVSNDAGAWMDLEYAMDAKKYIDSLALGTMHQATVE
jgi:hypothetical protein